MKTKKGGRFKSPFKLKQKGIEVIGKWKTVPIDPNLFGDEDFGDIVCLEELTEYKLVSSSKVGKVKEKKRKAESISEEGNEEEEEPSVPPKKKKKRKDLRSKTDKSSDPHAAEIDVPVDKEAKCKEIIKAANCENHGHVSENASSTKDAPKKKKAGKNKASQAQEALPSVTTSKKVKNWTTKVLSASSDQKADVSAWKDLFVPEPVLQALSHLGFSAPTPIQALALPSAIRDGMDVLGAAETGTNLLNWLYMLEASHLPFLNAANCYELLYVAEEAFIGRRRACSFCISNILVMMHCEVLKLCNLKTRDVPSLQSIVCKALKSQ